MIYYLIITSIIFFIIDYKNIYSIIDSKFLFLSPGSKLKKEITSVNSKKSFKLYDKLDMCILLILPLLLFIINFCISWKIFSIKPMMITILKKQVNLTEIMIDYESKFKLIYYISSALCFIFLSYNYQETIKNIALNQINKLIKKDNDIKNLPNEYIIARDECDECFQISEEALYQNVLITGSIGSGKTSGAISHITYNLIKSGKGGLILDAKGNFVDTIEQMCKMQGRLNDLVVISNKQNNFFQIMEEDISSLELANRIKQVISLLSPTNNSDPYWLDKVENVIMNFVIIMKYEKNLSIMELHKMITDDDYLNNVLVKLKSNILKSDVDEKTAFELSNALSFIANEYFKIDGRVSSIIKSEITRLTIPLITDYNIYSQFCEKGNKNLINFDDNKIIVLSLNIGENKSLCRIISTFLKLSYEKYVLTNISKQIPKFFIADEFQEFCNAEDAHFLSLSREAKCISIISTQSYSSLKSTLRDENAANVIIQNLVNKIWFRNDDNYTITEIVKQLGKINVTKENKSISEVGQESRKYLFRGGFRNKKSSITKALNYVSVKENEFDENFFSRELKTFEALSFFNTQDGIKIKKIIFERWK